MRDSDSTPPAPAPPLLCPHFFHHPDSGAVVNRWMKELFSEKKPSRQILCGHRESAIHDRAKNFSQFNSSGAVLPSSWLQQGTLPDENHSTFCKTNPPFGNNHKKRRSCSCHNGHFSSILTTKQAWSAELPPLNCN